MAIVNLNELKARQTKVSNQYAKTMTNKPKPRFEQYGFQKGKDFVGSEVEVVFLDTIFDATDPENRYGLNTIAEHPKVFGFQTDEYGKSLVPPNFNGYKEDVVWQTCPSSFGEDGCPICNGDLARSRKIEYKNSSDSKKNIPVLNTYLTVIELNPKNYDSKLKKEVPIINKATNEPYKLFKKLMPLNFDNKNSNAQAIMDVLIDAFSETNPETNKPYNSIRGVKLILKRDDDKMSAKVGAPKRYPAEKGKIGVKYKRLSESELTELCGYSESVKDGETKRYSNAEPYKYEELFKPITVEDVYVKYNIQYKQPEGKGDNFKNEKEAFLNRNSELDELSTLDEVDDENFNFDDDFDDL